MKPIETTTFYHHKKEGTYLYIADHYPWEQLPEALQQAFSQKNKVISFNMTPERKLARADSQTVYTALLNDGYYVQLPPSDPAQANAQEEQWIQQQEARKR